MNSSANQFSEAPKPHEQKSPESFQGASSPQEATQASESNTTPTRVHPIPPPSEPMQYRAIGLIAGQYRPSVEQMTQGTLISSKRIEIDAVLLGRVISLIKNHLDLGTEHLWVVYPRTKQDGENLHVQIMGVWEPETLEQDLSAIESKSVKDLPEVKDGYFSIRGAVVFYSEEAQKVVVKIAQSPKRKTDKPRSFKLELKGLLPSKAIGHFWEFQVQLQAKELVIQTAKNIGELPKPRGKFKKGRKPYQKSRRPNRPSSNRPVPKSAKTASSKPIIRKDRPPQS